MSENSDKDNKPQVTSKGVSGTKELKVRRVHKKKSEPAAEEQVKAPVEKAAVKAVEAEPVKAVEPAAEAVVKTEEKKASKTTAKKAESKKAEPKKVVETKKTTKSAKKEDK